MLVFDNMHEHSSHLSSYKKKKTQTESVTRKKQKQNVNT